MDIYKVAGAAGMLALCWMLQAWSLSTFLDAVEDGPPAMPAFTIKDIAEEDSNRPLADIAAEHGVALNDLLVSKTQIEEAQRKYNRAKLLGVAGTVIGALGGFIFALRIWESYLIATIVIIAGPLGIAFALHRQSRLD